MEGHRRGFRRWGGGMIVNRGWGLENVCGAYGGENGEAGGLEGCQKGYGWGQRINPGCILVIPAGGC